MKIESRDTVNPHDGIARNWCVGNLVVEWYVERPPQEWMKFDFQCSVRWFDE
jgi:hypothetical protein